MWIFGAVEDSLCDLLGVMEEFDVEQDEALAILAEVREWLRAPEAS